MFQTPNTDKLISFNLVIAGFLWRLQTARWATDFFFFFFLEQCSKVDFKSIPLRPEGCRHLLFTAALYWLLNTRCGLLSSALYHFPSSPSCFSSTFSYYTNSWMLLLSFLIIFSCTSGSISLQKVLTPRPFYLCNIWPGRREVHENKWVNMLNHNWAITDLLFWFLCDCAPSPTYKYWTLHNRYLKSRKKTIWSGFSCCSEHGPDWKVAFICLIYLC